MRRLRLAITMLLLAAALLATGGWVASYFWWPQVGFPWPTSGLGQTHDRGFLLLIDGRLFVVRQRAQATPAASIAMNPASQPTMLIGAARLTDPPQPAVMLESGDAMDSPGLPPGIAYWSADSRVLGALRIRTPQDGGGGASIVLVPIEPGLAATSWRRAGFAVGPLTTPRVRVADIDVTAFWTKTAIPLWPFVLLGAPAAWMLLHGRRARRWVEQGRCGACGYDLRQSPQRCPECGAQVPGAMEAEAVPVESGRLGVEMRTSPM